MSDILGSSQCRAARALLRWSQDTLVDASRVSKRTLANFELNRGGTSDRTRFALRQAFEDAGVTFIGDNGISVSGGTGVRLKHSENALS